MSEQITKKAAPKGNKTTELIIGQAAQKLVQALKAQKEAADIVGGLEAKVEESTLKLVNLEEQIANKEQELKNAAAQNKISIQQAFDADKETFVKGYVMEKGLTVVAASEVQQLKNDLQAAKTDVEQQISKEVGKQLGIAKSQHESALKVAQLEYNAKEAANVAEITQLKSQVTFLQEQSNMWKTQLDSERQASVQRAQAGAIGAINVTGAGK